RAGGLLREHGWLIVLITSYVGMGYLTAWWSGNKLMMDVGLYSPVLMTLVVCFSMAFVVIHAGWCMAAVKTDQSLLALWWWDLWTNYLNGGRVGRFLVIFLVLTPFADSFGSFKQAIPKLAPFAWDTQLMGLDLALHGGRHPWEWLQPVVGHPAVTWAIN